MQTKDSPDHPNNAAQALAMPTKPRPLAECEPWRHYYARHTRTMKDLIVWVFLDRQGGKCFEICPDDPDICVKSEIEIFEPVPSRAEVQELRKQSAAV